MASTRIRVEEVIPAAGRTINSLRDIGYELPQAVADLVDNSIEAAATEVRVDLVFDGAGSWVRIADNGVGMDTDTITESLRIGSVRDYGEDDLGKFGFGLKTASISQCRRLTVASRIAPQRARVEARVFDLDHIERTNRWEILILDPEDRPPELTKTLQETTGTVVLWQVLDRVLTYKDPDGHWARRKLLEQAESVAKHLGMVFHRFLNGSVRGRQRIKIFVNDAAVEGWDPFCLDQPSTEQLEAAHFKVTSEGSQGIVTLHPYVLPAQSEFSDANAFRRASGPNKWNNQQGLYVYRADRLIQWGGWNRIRTNDEHTKLARVSLDFSPELDAAFGINISKAIVKLPFDLRDEILPLTRLVCSAAQARYRSADRASRATPPPRPSPSPIPQPVTPTTSSGLGKPVANTPFGLPPMVPDAKHDNPNVNFVRPPVRPALEKAADDADAGEALERIMASLKRSSPEVAHDLGW